MMLRSILIIKKKEELKGSEWSIRNEAFRDLGSALSFPFGGQNLSPRSPPNERPSAGPPPYLRESVVDPLLG